MRQKGVQIQSVRQVLLVLALGALTALPVLQSGQAGTPGLPAKVNLAGQPWAKFTNPSSRAETMSGLAILPTRPQPEGGGRGTSLPASRGWARTLEFLGFDFRSRPPLPVESSVDSAAEDPE